MCNSVNCQGRLLFSVKCSRHWGSDVENGNIGKFYREFQVKSSELGGVIIFWQ